ncbi:FRIGIDA-like protein 3 isoform X1 [Castanea sativa]|uniref:FRIGIDA-like protein 3 isoform X1 n=2 Tax=Castanea sativa TaxID=21020 RepID=UPI003F64BD0F
MLFSATDFSILCDLTARNFLPSFGFKKTTNFKGNQLLVGRSFKLNCLVDREMDVSTSALVDGVAECLNGVIEVLVISGRQIDVVNLGFAFELTGQFSPMPLLKSYLKEARKASSPVKSGYTSPTAQNEVNDRELSALKAVLRCIEEHKLEEQYPVDPL